MPTFLSIKEAASRAEKAEITVRRFVQSVVKEQTKSAQRKLIQPTPAEVRALKKQKRPFSWKISEELIAKQFQKSSVPKSSAKPAEKLQKEPEFLSTLQGELESKQGQLKVKDDQIQALTEIVYSLNERMREGNVLMASLQKHLALPEGNTEQEEKKVKKSWIGKLLS